MYDVNALEKKWKRYKSKQRTPWIGSAILIVLIIVYVIFRTELTTVVSKYTPETNSSKAKVTQLNQSDKEHGKNLAVSATASQRAESNQSAQKKKSYPMMTIEVSDAESKTAAEKEHKRKYLKIEVTDRGPTKSQKTKKPGKPRTIKSVEKRFAKSGSYYDSLFLARSYYRQGQYSKAQKWALITNNLNSRVEESWLIFAKSKAKLGQKRQAIEILAVYSRKTNSVKAQKLLNQMRQGKF
ncbi:MAG: CDC27 family protein [Campylobacterota bacterium]|nr:CDC27 family protein [Campylobacterota bacterium]